MPTAIAAPNIAARSFELPKPPSLAPDGPSFASSLSEAKQKLPAKRTERRDEKEDAGPEAIEPAKKPERADRAAEDEAAVEPKATDEVAAPVEADANTEHRDDPKQGEPSVFAQAMAALAATPAEPAAEIAQPVDDVQHHATADANIPAAAAVTAAAAAASLPDDATIGNELAGQAARVDPKIVEAKPAVAAAKPGEAKLDPLVSEMAPVDGSEIDVPVAAPTASDGGAGGEAKGEAEQQPLPLPEADATNKSAADESKAKTFDELFSKLMPDEGVKPQAETKATAPKVEAPPLRPEQQFAKDNVDRVVSSVQAQVNASGNGSMRVRLDPPELGALDVAVKMLDGRMTASFTTSNDQATQLLSHSLNSLKASLENAGIAVDRIEVRQAAPASAGANDRNTGEQQQSDRGFSPNQQQQGEQQRKQMVDRLWRKYAYGSDEVDLVA